MRHAESNGIPLCCCTILLRDQIALKLMWYPFRPGDSPFCFPTNTREPGCRSVKITGQIFASTNELERIIRVNASSFLDGGMIGCNASFVSPALLITLIPARKEVLHNQGVAKLLN